MPLIPLSNQYLLERGRMVRYLKIITRTYICVHLTNQRNLFLMDSAQKRLYYLNTTFVWEPKTKKTNLKFHTSAGAVQPANFKMLHIFRLHTYQYNILGLTIRTNTYIGLEYMYSA